MEPLHAEDMPQLEAALKLLNQADPFVEITMQESGEHVLGAAGPAQRHHCLFPTCACPESCYLSSAGTSARGLLAESSVQRRC